MVMNVTLLNQVRVPEKEKAEPGIELCLLQSKLNYEKRLS
jgi:hypothetical protein